MKARDAGALAALASAILAIAGPASVARAGGAPPHAPETTITVAPHSATFERHPRIAFHSSLPGSEFRCSVDGGGFRDCRPPWRSPRLDYGRHVFRVQAVRAGEADSTPAEVRFRVVARREVIGESVLGQAIVAERWGEPWHRRSAVLVGNIHGDETQGIRVIDRIDGRTGRRLRGVDLWTIRTVNPDGLAADRRGNEHHVDLNRNFPYAWRSIPRSSGYYSGPHPLSEPESRAVKRFLRRVRPDVSIWYHQPWGATLVPCNRSDEAALLYARLSGLGPRRDCNQGAYPGSVISWENHALRTVAFVVELPGGSLSEAEVRRHQAAAIAVAKGP